MAALPNSFGKFYSGKKVISLRRKFQLLRKELQEFKKLRKVKEIERRGRRIMNHINHIIFQQLVQLAGQRL